MMVPLGFSQAGESEIQALLSPFSPEPGRSPAPPFPYEEIGWEKAASPEDLWDFDPEEQDLSWQQQACKQEKGGTNPNSSVKWQYVQPWTCLCENDAAFFVSPNGSSPAP